ncbi:MAG: response regulator transcription factor [Dehalococcoidia bacterium]
MAEPAPSVVVVARSPAVRAGLRALLESQGIAVNGELAPAAVDLSPLPFDVMVAEATAFAEFDAPPALSAVVVGDDPDALAAFAEMPAARAFLGTEAGPAELAAAVHAVAAGLVAFEPRLLRRLAMPGTPAGTSDAGADLTAREREVLTLMAAGLPNKTIALRLGISEHTAKFHVGTVLAKLGAASRTEAVMTAARRGLLPL